VYWTCIEQWLSGVELMTWVDGQASGRRTRSLREIRADEILAITDIAPHRHPVFRLTLAGNDDSGPSMLVLKFEFARDGGARFAATTEIMQIVDPGAIAEVLSESEERALLQAQSKGTPYLRECIQVPGFIIVKMKLRKEFEDLQSPDPRNGLTEKQVRIIKAVMPKLVGNERVWRTLGEIVAVDLFLGNSDRIAPQERDPFDEKEYKGPGKAVLQNAGNIFLKFDESGELKKALALDNYNARGSATSLDEALPPDWLSSYAPILASGGIMSLFTQSVIKKVVRHAAKVGIEVELGEKERTCFFLGMRSGIEKMIAFLVQRTGQIGQRLQPGLVSRAKYLRWLS
jgi:hypothetical protein